MLYIYIFQIGDEDINYDDDETHLLGPTSQEMDDFASSVDTKRCESIAV